MDLLSLLLVQGREGLVLVLQLVQLVPEQVELLVKFLQLWVCLRLLRVLLSVQLLPLYQPLRPLLFLLQVVRLLLHLLDLFGLVSDLRLEPVYVLSVLHPLLLLLKVAVLFLGDSELFLGVLDLFDLPLDLGEGTGVKVVVGPRLLVLELDGVVLFEKHIDGDVQGPQGGAQVLVHLLEVDVLVLKSYGGLITCKTCWSPSWSFEKSSESSICKA